MSPINLIFKQDPDPKGEAARISKHPNRLLGRLSRALRRRSVSPGRLARLARAKARELQELDPDAGVRLGELLEWIDAQAESNSLEREDEQRAEEDVLPWLDGVLGHYLAPAAQAVREEQSRRGSHLGRILASGFLERHEIQAFLNGKGDQRSVEELVAETLARDGGGEEEGGEEDTLAGIMVGPESRTCRTFSYYIDSRGGNDDWAGTREYPFKTFWPLRCLFALIEVHGLTGGSYSLLRFQISLKGNSHFDFDSDFASPPGRMPTFLSIGEWSSLASLHGDLPLNIARIYLKDKKHGLTSDEKTIWGHHYEAYGEPGAGAWFAGCFYPQCFLKVPKFLGAIYIMAYDYQPSTRPTISGPWTYNRSAEGSWDKDNAVLTRKAGAFNAPHGEDVWPIGMVFHDNVNVGVADVMMRGFFTGLRFWGVCQEVNIRRLTFCDMRRNGIQINLIENKDFLQWKITQEAHAGRIALAWFPVLFDDCPCDFEVDECLFMHIGLTTSDSAIGLANCASNLEIHHSTFAACMDGVMADQGGSGLHVHDNAFVALYEANPPGGDANAVDLKAVRPRTAERKADLYLDPVPLERWTSVHDNYILGGSCGGLIVHKGTGWLHIFNNYLIDNWFGFGLAPKAIAVVAANEGYFDHYPLVILPHLHNPYDVKIPSDWRSPLDRREVTDSGRTCFSSKSIYLYRNVIAANWSHGMNIQEGVVESAADRVPIAYGLSIIDLVIAHNTVDSNGGAFLRRVNEDRWGGYDLCPSGYGICMMRRGPDGRVDYLPFDDSKLGDRFENVAIYNNLLTNNFSLQLLIADGRQTASLPWKANVEPIMDFRGKDALGIRWFRYYGVDFNGYFMVSDDPLLPGRFTYQAAHMDGWIRRGSTPLEVYTDAKVAVDTPSGRQAILLSNGEFQGSLFMELNGVCQGLNRSAYWDIYTRSPFRQQVSDYTWSEAVRIIYPGLSLALFYAERADEGFEGWRPLAGSAFQEQGAWTGPRDPSTVSLDLLHFPDDTRHAETDLQICDSPDIVGEPASGRPDMGAFKILK